MARVLGKLDILTAPDRPPVPVAVPEWREPSDTENPVVYIRQMSVPDRHEFARLIGKDADDAKIERIAFTFLACDEAGTPLFTAEDAAALAEKNGAAIARVSRRAIYINGFGAAPVDDHEKN